MIYARTKDSRRTRMSAEQHGATLQQAITAFDVNPYALEWHYVHAAMLVHGNVSATARALKMHRRTVQRILDKKEPKA